ncbi:hypothetical protein ACJ72_08730 [Emergomyces africanus]|uniref:NmrA-like domain-containing protein n=1 Tax=Emergomyces africanus TaxID=1955775 RepID=A0A1B7NJX8_9EURO|nr:hypothetical protein ACJ72_08730 [Emergomyces africanus]
MSGSAPKISHELFNVQSAIVSALLNSPHGYSVSTLSREQSSYTPPAGVTNIKTDFTHGSLVQALKGQDVVVSAIAGSAIMEQIKIIDAAIEVGVQRFIPSQYGGETRNKVTQSRVSFFALKNQVYEYLRERQDKIAWTSFLSGPLLEE